jgi:hypothetical protein
MRGIKQAGNHSAIASGMCVLALILPLGPAAAEDAVKTSFPSMVAVEQYRMSRAEEIAMARSAAPASISNDAEILVLGDHGYETAVKGKSGFVCLVERSWFSFFGDSSFWNPRLRGPDCLNAAAASTVLAVNLERTQWALAGVSQAEMLARSKSSVTAQKSPAPGAMGYMMSKQGHLNDAVGHWHPHLMFFVPHGALAGSGANLQGSPMFGQEGGPEEATILFIPVAKWSDGTAASMKME